MFGADELQSRNKKRRMVFFVENALFACFLVLTCLFRVCACFFFFRSRTGPALVDRLPYCAAQSEVFSLLIFRDLMICLQTGALAIDTVGKFVCRNSSQRPSHVSFAQFSLNLMVTACFTRS